MRLIPLLAAIVITVACWSSQTPMQGTSNAAQRGKSSNTTAVEQAAGARLDAPAVPLSAMARLGEKMFFDPSLSGSGKMSCSTCHDPAHAYAPANGLPAQLGGSELRLQGIRAVPTLTYLERTPRFRVRLDSASDPDEHVVAKASRLSASLASVRITPGNYLNPLHGEPVVPEGGMDWDGRAATLADQPSGPLLDPREMANRDAAALLAKLKAAPYANEFTAVFDADALGSPKAGLADMYLALARFMTEDRSFHAYNSKFDYYLAGRVQLTAQELRGLQLFDDPNKGNCAMCHLDKPTKNRAAPAFTDYEFEALAVPRNRHLAVNRDPAYFDEGLCGPLRKDVTNLSYCGLFKTPTLRNVATRRVFFHNGAVHSLEDAVRFYVERETRPERWYPRRADGTVAMYDDLPPGHRAAVDVKDAPFNRHRGEKPALDEQEIKDIVAFLNTLTDGYRP
ncbi:cytochrome-c peroxidase [Acidicapsa dinghuensis]|uniref:Cytochrome-c peroxidase n=1 Tax=Acidicapsa dinghuensis TaxID=2218256 RepID=A0ABW1EI80_9BACT|nr:cytochrome c peroxidase [Acidicapsa dinghuensis]